MRLRVESIGRAAARRRRFSAVSSRRTARMQESESEKTQTRARAGTASSPAAIAHISARKLLPLHFSHEEVVIGFRLRFLASKMTAA